MASLHFWLETLVAISSKMSTCLNILLFLQTSTKDFLPKCGLPIFTDQCLLQLRGRGTRPLLV